MHHVTLSSTSVCATMCLCAFKLCVFPISVCVYTVWLSAEPLGALLPVCANDLPVSSIRQCCICVYMCYKCAFVTLCEAVKLCVNVRTRCYGFEDV